MIEIAKIKSTEEYISRIDVAEIGEDFAEEVKKNGEEIFGIFHEKTIIGLAYVESDSKPFIVIYVFKEYRNQGFGALAFQTIEKELKPKSESIHTVYIQSNEIAKRFAMKMGFHPTWASSFMKYRGERFEEPNLTVRKYRDEDYLECFALAEEAFHRMRVGTGCFPDSKMREPSEESRKAWLEEAENEWVLLENDAIVGYAHAEDEELNSVSIKIDHQGKGLGRAFVKYMTNRLFDRGAKEPALWCVVGNNNARHIYDTLGYQEVFTEQFADKRVS